ncbi:MAG: thioredoxin family protein [Flavobacteriales bacterium]|jgi:protein disulfide-isomerase
MKSIFLSIALTVSTFITWSQTTSTLTWYTDISLASQAATTENKPMLLFFTGSDWCGWCHRLQREVFNTTQFNAWASTDVILVELDFPKNKVLPQNIKEQNEYYHQLFAVEGYPTVWFVNVTKVEDKFNLAPLNSTGYLQGGPDVWITNAKAIINGGK